MGSREFGDTGLSGDFSVFDDNANGFLEEEEFDTFMEELGISGTDDRIGGL